MRPVCLIAAPYVLAVLAACAVNTPPGPASSAGRLGSAAALEPVEPSTEAGDSRCLRDEPADSATVVHFFGPLFSGTYPVINHFDHDEPRQFVDLNGYQIDWCGRRRIDEIDGHSGYDFRMPEGTRVLAPADGIVTGAGKDIRFFCPLKGRDVTDQLRVKILHTLPDGRRVTSIYKHLGRVDVRRWQHVRAGEPIGLSGNTGCSSEPHLHFETWLIDGTRNRRPVLIDAYGWAGNGSDPWAGSDAGAPSIWLWKRGQAPDIFAPVD